MASSLTGKTRVASDSWQRLLGGLDGEARVAAQVVIFERVVPEPGGVVVAEPIAPVVAVAATYCVEPLSASTRRSRGGTVIASADAHAIDRAAAVAIGAVDPAIEAAFKAVQPVLLVAFLEASEKHALLGGVAINFGGERIWGRGRDDDAVAPGYDAIGEGQAIGKVVACA